MRVSEYFTGNKLVHCRIILKLDSHLTGLIRKYRVGLVVLTQYLLPLVIASIFYTKCIQKMLSRKRIGKAPLLPFYVLIGWVTTFFAFFKHSGERNTHQEALFYRSKMRTIKMLVLSLSAFALAWLPVHLVHFIDFYIYPLMPKQCNSSFTYNFFYWAAISSISFNPFIYCSYDNKVRSTAQRCCCCCFSLRYSEGKWHLPKEPSVRESQRVRCYTSNASASTIN